MSEKKIAASTPYRRTGCRVISTTSSGSMQDSSIADALAQGAVLRQRAARLAHEPHRGVRRASRRARPAGTGCRVGGRTRPRILPGQAACWHIGVRPAPTYCERHGGRAGDERRARSATPAGVPGRRRGACSAARLRPEIFCEEMPAPQRIAPYAAALSADVTVDGTDIGTGRIIVLHDPAGNDAWDGTFRCVAYARADIDPELITDPLLAEVGWSWLTEALDAHGARVRRRLGHRHPGRHRELRRHGRRGRHRPDRDPRVVDALRAPTGRRTTVSPTSPRTSRRGASCCARRPGCRPCPRGWRRCRAGEGSAGADAEPRGTHRRGRDPDRRSRADEPEPPRPRCWSCATACPAIVDDPGRAGRGLCRRWPPGTGPVAIDAERASGYRYSARAYLIQLRREGSGTALVDPIAVRLAGPAAGGAGGNRVDPARRHPGPAVPDRGRPGAGRRCSTPSSPDACSATRASAWPPWSRSCSGRRLRKEHSAVDWSTRPLPEPWLEYAALDVEVLVELRDAAGRAAASRPGKAEWAAQEFDAPARLRAGGARRRRGAAPPGAHRLRGRRAMAVVRSLWETRDRIARERDVVPEPADPRRRDRGRRPGHADRHPGAAGDQRASTAAAPGGTPAQWMAAIDAARQLPEDRAAGPRAARRTGPPRRAPGPTRTRWRRRRLVHARAAVAELGERVSVPVENLLTPDHLRRVLWTPPATRDPEQLADAGRRPAARRTAPGRGRSS